MDLETELTKQINQMLESGKATMITMREGGFVSEMAKLYAKFVRELQHEGFSRAEAIEIVSRTQLVQKN